MISEQSLRQRLTETMSYGSLSHRKQGGIDEIHRAAATAKGYLAMRPAMTERMIKQRMISITALVLVIKHRSPCSEGGGTVG